MSTAGPCSTILEAIAGHRWSNSTEYRENMTFSAIFVDAKLEYFNPGGSVKDRVALKMIEKAENEGRLRPGMTIIEPSSGNTGIALALVAAVKGYKCIVVMPQQMSDEKLHVLKALGARVRRTPNVAYDSADSHISVAHRMRNEIQDSVVLDQYKNPANPESHSDGTGSELVAELDGKVDMVVIGAGTGGTITGIARKVKSVNPECTIVGVDPVGSLISCPNGCKAPFEVEGIGHDFVPANLDKSLVDEWIQVADIDSFNTARNAISREGILCGGSSGAIIWAAMQASKKLKKGQNCVVIIPDGVRNYYSRFISTEWMTMKRFLVEELPYELPLKPVQLENSVLDAIGQTPLVRLNKIPQSLGVQCEIYAKCEFLSPSFTIEDRIALMMIEEAEKSAKLQPGVTIIRPTTGNCDLGIAEVAAVKGYKLILVTSSKITEEKEDLLKALGAQIAYASPESYLKVSHCLNQEIGDSVVLETDPSVVRVYESVIREILAALDRVDLVIFKDSIIRLGANGAIVKIESCLTPPTERDSLEMTKRLIREEGLLCGLSSGEAMLVASLASICLPKEKRVVTVLPDGISDYLMWLNGR